MPVTQLTETREPLESLAEFDAYTAAQRSQQSRRSQEAYQRELAVYEEVYLEAVTGGSRASVNRLREALTTPEFPVYFGDILDRALLARFTTWIPPIMSIVLEGTFTDLTRNKKRTQWRGGNQSLGRVGEGGPYPERGQTPFDFEWKGEKYGADFFWSWETMLADDLGGLRDLDGVLASAARYSESLFVTNLYVDTNGPHASLYTVGQGNKGTAVLSISALEAGITASSDLRDPVTNVPVLNRPRYLVVPPALEITALQILQNELQQQQDSATPVPTRSVIPQFGLQLIVDPNIPIVASNANGDTSWFLFSEPNAGPLGPGLAALAFDRLRGAGAPILLKKRSEFMSLGGGNDPRGDLDALDLERIRVVHAFGGSQLFFHATWASDGSS